MMENKLPLETANPYREDLVDESLFEQIWPEFCKQIDIYCGILLSERVNSLGFSLHGSSGSGKTVFANRIGTLCGALVHHFTGLDLIYSYGKFLDSPLKRTLASSPGDKPILFVIDDADVLVVGKQSTQKKAMGCFIEELDVFRKLKRRILFVIITREENQLHRILRRDEYFPHSFCIPPLSTANIRYVVSFLLEKFDNNADNVSRVVVDRLQQGSENMIPEWNGCVLGHITYFITTFLNNVWNSKTRDRESIVKQWQRSIETVFSSVIQRNPEWTMMMMTTNQKPLHSVVDLSFHHANGLSETFHDLLTLVEYSLKLTNDDEIFPSTVSPFRGALIYGPCGVGKTTLCQRVVEKLGLPVFVIDGASLLASAIGQSEKTLKNCFSVARKFSPSVVLVDQIDMVFQKRDFADETSAQSLSRLTCLFLSEMDGFATSRQPEFFVLATAQNLDKIDPALLRPGRLEYKRMLDLPTCQQRYQYLCDFLKQVKEAGIIVDEAVEEKQWMDWIIQCTDMWSVADLSMLFRSLLLCCLKENSNAYHPLEHLKRKHFEQVLFQKQQVE